MLHCFPNDLLFEIAEYLGYADYCNLSCTNKPLSNFFQTLIWKGGQETLAYAMAWAAHHGSITIMRKVIERGGRLYYAFENQMLSNIFKQEPHGEWKWEGNSWNPLGIAVHKRRRECVAFLLDQLEHDERSLALSLEYIPRRYKMCYFDNYPLAPRLFNAHCAAYGTVLLSGAIIEEDSELIRLLLTSPYVKINIPAMPEDLPPLSLAIIPLHYQEHIKITSRSYRGSRMSYKERIKPVFNKDIAELLLRRNEVELAARLERADWNVTTPYYSRTPLIFAIMSGNNWMTEQLITRCNVDINKMCHRNIHPLYYALIQQDPYFAQLLLDQPGISRTGIHTTERRGSALFERACMTGNVAIVRLLMDRIDIDPGPVSNGVTLYGKVNVEGYTEIMELLLEHYGSQRDAFEEELHAHRSQWQE